MPSEHPFLQDTFQIPWSSLTPDRVKPDIGKALADARQAVDTVAAAEEPLDYAKTFRALEDALEPLNHAWGKVSHLETVCNSPELRDAYNAMLPEVSDFFAGIPLHAGLWGVLKRFGESAEAETLSPAKRRHVAETLAEFREAGADLPDAQKEHARAIQNRLATLTQKFSENVLDATHAWEKVVTDERLLAGLPESALAAAREDARAKGHGSDDAPAWRFTLQAPSLLPVLTYAENDELRREVWEAHQAIGREPPYDNAALVREILELRHEFAGLIGKKDFADLVTERRMVGSGKAALDFTRRLHGKTRDAFRAEREALRTFKAESTGGSAEPLEPWESAYWAERWRRARFDFDEEALRPYFPINAVIDGLFDLAHRVFRLRIEARPTAGPGETPAEGAVEVWHPDVRFYDMFDETDAHIGSFYADWHPRESKRGGAWMNTLLTGERDPTVARPEAHLGLICGNLTPSVGGRPALLTHREVETIFHEFGHLLHHLCGNAEVKSLNGVNVPWDFVELPSQLMENWCWRREGLDCFARHHETGDPIPEALFAKMLGARNHMRASMTMRQLSFGELDLGLHMDWPTLEPRPDLDPFVEERVADYTPEYRTRPKPNTFQFHHLFSDPTGYAAGYYSYKWAEVLDADAFTRFLEEGVLNPEVGREFRERILARGNTEDPARLFRDFMGRDPDPDALLRRDGLLG